jgi:ATP-binding cassette subfamily B protein
MQSSGTITSRALKILMNSSGRATAASAAVLVLRSFLPLVAVLLIRFYVDHITGSTEGAPVSAPGAVTGLIIAMALTLLADELLSFSGQYFARRQSFLVEGHISSMIHSHATGLGMRFFDDPAFYDRLSRAARDISWRPAAIVSDMIMLLRGVISFAAMAYILRTFGLVPLTILVLVFIPVMWIRFRNSSRVYQARKSVTTETRQAAYFSWLMTGEKPAREVRLFGLGEYFEKLFRRYFREAREPELSAVKKNTVMDGIASVFKVAAFTGILVYATGSYINSKITAGELAMYLVAFRQALVYLRDAVSGYTGLAENRLFLQDLFHFLDMEGSMTGSGAPPGPGAFREITVENVSFTYPDSSRPALENISLKISGGERVAVVGPNGSGKTTLVKMLCRLYDPDSGRILLNGSDISTIEPEAYRRLFSVVFQNFMLYFLSARDNIRLAVTDGDDDPEKVRKAAAMAGISELLEELPQGYDTMLGHHTEGSREMSWGEWQKIAIARALYREAPVLILDEPSSSLDADSEYEIFSDMGRITGGRTCIFISHRLSNVREADRIIVLDHGRIAETGTHDDLMKAGGRYFTMFTRQKSMYK